MALVVGAANLGFGDGGYTAVTGKDGIYSQVALMAGDEVTRPVGFLEIMWRSISELVAWTWTWLAFPLLVLGLGAFVVALAIGLIFWSANRRVPVALHLGLCVAGVGSAWSYWYWTSYGSTHWLAFAPVAIVGLALLALADSS